MPVRAPLLSKEAAFAIAHRLFKRSFPSAAFLVCLAFHRFLHTGEFLCVLAGHVTLCFQPLSMHVVLPHCKTAARKRTIDTVFTFEPMFVRCFARLLKGLGPADPILRMSLPEFRAAFAEAVSFVGLPCQFKPYSLRRGGATAHFHEGGSMDATQEIDRWSDARTARIYTNTALLELTRAHHLHSSKIKAGASEFLSVARRFTA